MIIRRAVLTGTFLSLAVVVSALEIAVQRSLSKKRDSQTVAFVDMERVYQEFPETRKARQEYLEQADKLKQSLADKAAELSDLRDQLAVLRDASSADAIAASTAAAAPPSIATGTTKGALPAVPAVSTGTLQVPRIVLPPSIDLQQREQTLADQETALAQAQADAARTLSEFEKKRAAQIFGKLYTALMQLADERGVDMVLDKSALLYGQGGLDLTEDLSRRVRGLPDPQPQ
jgi:Skp family chaperone for outer membrane proteins